MTHNNRKTINEHSSSEEETPERGRSKTYEKYEDEQDLRNQLKDLTEQLRKAQNKTKFLAIKKEIKF
nr:2432_t:CDS:2 [Entrophospora candida]